MASGRIWVPPDIEIDPSKPLYEQFADVIRVNIASGRLEAGDRMPSVRDLASIWRVNPNTVMRAYRDLESAHFIVTQRGQGTFVARDPQVIEKSRRAIARRAWSQLEEVAQSIGLGVDELISLARDEETKSHE